MTLSRRDLYQAGEPLGDCTTARRPDGRYVCGGGGSSSSSAQTTTNTDKRLVVDSGLGVSADNSSVVVDVTTADPTIVDRALDTVDVANATNAEGFTKLLDAAESLFDRGEALIGQTQNAVADAWSSAATNKAATIDNRTIIVLAVAAAVTAYAITRK